MGKMVIRKDNGSVIGIYESGSFEKKAAEQRFQRVLKPFLEQLLDEDAPKEVTIDKKNQLCINGTPVGDWQYISQFKLTDLKDLEFDYGYGRKRVVYFGMQIPGWGRRTGVQMIFQLKGEQPLEIIYDSDRDK